MRALPVLAALVLLSGCRRPDAPVVEETDSTLVLGGAEAQSSARRRFTTGGRTVLFTRLNGTADLSFTDEAEAELVFTERIPAGGRHNADMKTILGGPQVRFTVERPVQRDARTNAVDVRGTLPLGTPVELRMDEGTVVLRDPSARVIVRMERGTVQVTGARAELALDVGSGTLDVTLARLAAPLHLRTRNGSISLALPAASDATVSALAGLRIDTEGLGLPPALAAEGRQRLTGVLGAGTHRVSLLATSGSVRLGALSGVPSGTALDSAAARAGSPDSVAR